MGTVVGLDECVRFRIRQKQYGKKVVFTNGVFDILHRGHIEYLTAARAMGDALIVGMNGDESVRRLKGPSRPVVLFEDRSIVLAALAVVDLVVGFTEDTPYELLRRLVPDVLVKGADWQVDEVVGKDLVEAAGGIVRTIDFVPDRSSTAIIDKIRTGTGV
jgi:rfaE bifunctional protein nucleotidyltransferase chain/domain